MDRGAPVGGPNIDARELEKAVLVELEHCDDAERALEIALANLEKNPAHYKDLHDLEQRPTKTAFKSGEIAANLRADFWLRSG